MLRLLFCVEFPEEFMETAGFSICNFRHSSCKALTSEIGDTSDDDGRLLCAVSGLRYCWKAGEPSLNLLTGLNLSVGRCSEWDSLYDTGPPPADTGTAGLPTSITVERPVLRCRRLPLPPMVAGVP